jgi:hypothetical protein
MIYALTRFLLPLGFAAIGMAWSVGGEWDKFLRHRDGAFSSYQISNLSFRGSFLFGSLGAATGISIEQHLARKEKQQREQARKRLIAQVQTLTGSNLPDDTRAAIHLILEDLNHADC